MSALEQLPCEEEPEVFELLIFHKGGTLSIQTNKNVYFQCDAIFYAATQLKNLISGQDTSLDYGIKQHMIDVDNPPPDKCIIDRELLNEAMSATEIQCDNDVVVKFFSILRQIS